MPRKKGPQEQTPRPRRRRKIPTNPAGEIKKEFEQQFGRDGTNPGGQLGEIVDLGKARERKAKRKEGE